MITRHSLMVMKWCSHKSQVTGVNQNFMWKNCTMQSTDSFALLTTSKLLAMIITSGTIASKVFLVCRFLILHHAWYVLDFLEFWFNYKNSYLGSLVNNNNGGNSARLPFQSFIATCLLPCGPTDKDVTKFTGNNSLNSAKDSITQIIHAFTHFAYKYTRNNMFFCDLQGMMHLSSYIAYTNFVYLPAPQNHLRYKSTGILAQMPWKGSMMNMKKCATRMKLWIDDLLLTTTAESLSDASTGSAQHKQPLHHGELLLFLFTICNWETTKDFQHPKSNPCDDWYTCSCMVQPTFTFD